MQHRYIVLGLVLVICFFQAAAKELDVKLNYGEVTKKELRSQMFEIQVRMERLLDSISRGQWEKIKLEAHEMQNNYMFKGKLTNGPDAKTAPKDFVKMESDFHQAAADLLKSADKRNANLMLNNYNRLVGTCLRCHAAYAPYMFESKDKYTPPEDLPQKYYKFPDDWR